MTGLSLSATVRAAAAAALLFAGGAGTAWGQGEPLISGDDPPTGRFDSIYVPTPNEVVYLMLKLAEVTPDDFVVDLGSGDGRIPIAAARDFGARGLGVDLDEHLVDKSIEYAKEAGVDDRVEFRVQNLFDTDISDATVLTLYLLPHVNEKLRPVILEKMKPGTRVVAHQFDLGEWPPDVTRKVYWREIFLWIVPARVEGRWRVEAPDGAFDIALEQSYQSITGTAEIDGRPVPLREAKLRGAEITFTVEEPGVRRIYSGRVDGDAIEAAPEGNPHPRHGAVREWRAVRQ